MAQFEIGSISTGTLRPEDLLPTFARELERHAPDHALVHEANATLVYDDGDASELINEIQDELQNYCPPFVIFGSHPGDGADFGYWPDMESLDEALTQHDVGNPDGNGDVVLDDEGVVVNVNDHGNVTVMDLERNVLWAVV
jgi:hypothetical protein